MTENEALALFKCLADKSRLQILKSLSREDMYVERLAERLGLTAPTVSFHLKKLSDVGAVRSYKTQYYTMYALQEETLRPSMLSLIQADSSEAALQAQRDEAYRQKVLSSFLVYGKLKSIPTQKKKERIVLEELVKAFDITGISKSPAIFDRVKLDHFNAVYLRNLSAEAFCKVAEPYIRQSVKGDFDMAAIAALPCVTKIDEV